MPFHKINAMKVGSQVTTVMKYFDSKFVKLL